MSASEKFFEAMSSLQGEENNYQENFDAIKQLNAISDPESFGLQAFQNFAEIFAPHLISEGLGSMFAGGSTVAKVASKVVKGDFQGAIKEGTDAVGSRVQSVVEDAVQNVRQQASDLADAVQSGQTGLVDAIQGAANQATGGLAQITENVTNIANQAGQSANEAVNSIMNVRFPGTQPVSEIAANPLADIEPTMENVFTGVSRGLESLSGTARSQYQDILTGRGTSFSALTDAQQTQALADRAALIARNGLQDGQSALQSLGRPMDMPGTTSNQIGDLFNPARTNVDLPDLPDLDMVQDVISSNVQDTVQGIATGARNITGPQIQGVFSRLFGTRPPQPTGAIDEELGDEPLEAVGQSLGSGLTQQVTGAATQAVTQLEGATQSVTQALSDVGSAVKQGVGSIVKDALPGVAEDAVDEVTAGAEAGPEGLLVGGALALGTFLIGLFTHHSSSIPEPPPVTLAQPIFTAGLSNA